MSYPDLDTLCRLCLNKDAGTINIFESKADAHRTQQISVPMRIMACVALEVHANDALPKNICSDCRYQLEKTFVFRKRAQIAESKLRKHMRLINAGKVSKVFCKNEDDDEEELELEDSLHFLKEQESEREIEQDKAFKRMRQEHAKELEKLRSSLEAKFAQEMKERLAVMKKNLMAEAMETIKTEFVTKLREECLASAKEELREELRAECLQIENENLLKDLELFLHKRKQRSSSTPSQIKETSQTANSNKRDRSLDTSTRTLRSKRKKTSLGASHTESDTAEQVVHESYEVQKSKEDDNFILLDSDSNQYNAEFIETNENDQENEVANYQIEDEDGEQYAITAENNNADLAVYQIKDNGEIQTVEKDDDEDVLYLNMSEVAENDEDENEEFIETKKQNKSEESTTLFLSANPTDLTNICGYTKHKKNIDDSSEKDSSDTVVYGNTTDTPKIFRCELCPIVFSTENTLNRHYKTHERLEKKGVVYKCPECHVCFSCRSALNRHAIIHTGARPYKCDECGKSFVQREILKRHQKVHTGERPHKCPHCPRAYTQKVNLQQHINHNHSKMPLLQQHSCHLCPKRFNHASGLSRHLTTHSGITYQCIRCQRKFGDRSSVKRHLLAVHLVTASKFIKECSNNTDSEDKQSTEQLEV